MPAVRFTILHTELIGDSTSPHRVVATFDAPQDAPGVEAVAAFAWMIANKDREFAMDDVERSTIDAYRALRVRSMCVGDVLVIERADGSQRWLRAASFGFGPTAPIAGLDLTAGAVG